MCYIEEAVRDRGRGDTQGRLFKFCWVWTTDSQLGGSLQCGYSTPVVAFPKAPVGRGSPVSISV